MFGIIRFLLVLGFIVVIGLAVHWRLTTPTPKGAMAQIIYLQDAIEFKLKTRSLKEKSPSLTSLKLIRPLADQGNLVAQMHMAQLLFRQGVENEEAYKLALHYLKPSVEKGIPIAMNAYGVALRDGLGGVPQNKVEAYKWFGLAAERGLTLAHSNKLALTSRMTPAEIEKAERLIRQPADKQGAFPNAR